MEKRNKKAIMILSITILGMLIGILIYIITKNSFLFLREDRFMDYANSVEATRLGVYSRSKGCK